MDAITKSVKFSISRKEVFRKFLHEFNAWWPKAYTWSQEKLQEIRIDAKKDGLCTEIGPFGFRCDWGRVTDLEENRLIVLKWQISPKREPIPNPEKSSTVRIEFTDDGDSTFIKLEHSHFGNHGSDSDSYKQAMNSEVGWDYILAEFKTYCEK